TGDGVGCAPCARSLADLADHILDHSRSEDLNLETASILVASLSCVGHHSLLMQSRHQHVGCRKILVVIAAQHNSCRSWSLAKAGGSSVSGRKKLSLECREFLLTVSSHRPW